MMACEVNLHSVKRDFGQENLATGASVCRRTLLLDIGERHGTPDELCAYDLTAKCTLLLSWTKQLHPGGLDCGL